MHQSTDDSSPPADNGNADFHSGDLRQNYQNAVECLIACEALLITLQQSIASKDEQISTLEEKLIQMSLELASSKAKEDADALEHRLSMHRLSINSISDDSSDIDDEEGRLSTLLAANRQGRRPSCVMPRGTVVKTSPPSNHHRQSHAEQFTSSWSRFSSSITSTDNGSTSDVSDTAMISLVASSGSVGNPGRHHVRATDESSSSRLSGFGQFFRRSATQGLVQVEFPQKKDDEGKANSHHDDINDDNYDDNCPRRRPPNRKRMQLEIQKSISGVVFPNSFEEVVSKGLDLRCSLKKKSSIIGSQ